MRAGEALGDPWTDDRWYVPTEWLGQASKFGALTPEVILTLSAVYMGVKMISQDIATFPCQLYRYLDDAGAKERARNHPLSDVLRWQANSEDTAEEFWSLMVGQMLLRGDTLAEVIAGPRGFADQLVPIHSDRVTPERLPNRRRRYQIRQDDGTNRTLTQDQVFRFKDFTIGGLKTLSRFSYGLRSLSLAITQEKFTLNYFNKGATAALVATRPSGEMNEEEERAMHGSITRYLSGVDNAGGLLLIEDDIKITSIGVDMHQAQITELKQQAIHEVERWLGMPAGRLGAGDSTHADAAVEISNIAYGTSCLRPIVVKIEQAIRRDLILQPQTYFVEFNMDALYRGDLATRGEYWSKAVGNWMWPSEIRLKENMNPDQGLDELAKVRQRPGTPKGAQNSLGSGNSGDETADPSPKPPRNAKAQVRATLLAYDAAQQVIRKELAAVGKLAEKHAADASAWKSGLQTFYGDHAGFVAQKLRIPARAARGYCDGHRAQLEADGISIMEGWEHTEAEALVALSAGEDA